MRERRVERADPRPEGRHHQAEARRQHLGRLLPRRPGRDLRGGDRRSRHDREPRDQRGGHGQAHRPVADSGIDVAFVSGQYAQALNEAGLLEPIDKTLDPEPGEPLPRGDGARLRPGQQVSRCRTPGARPASATAPTSCRPTPTSWNDLLEPGARARRQDHHAVDRALDGAARAQGARACSVNTTEPRRARSRSRSSCSRPRPPCSPTTTRPSTRSSSPARPSMTEAWDGWCNYGIAEDPNIKFVVPDEGSDLWTDTMVVLKTSKNKEAAQAFINYILEPEVQAWVAENILYKVPNEAAMELVDPAVIAALPEPGDDPGRAARAGEHRRPRRVQPGVHQARHRSHGRRLEHVRHRLVTSTLRPPPAPLLAGRAGGGRPAVPGPGHAHARPLRSRPAAADPRATPSSSGAASAASSTPSRSTTSRALADPLYLNVHRDLGRHRRRSSTVLALAARLPDRLVIAALPGEWRTIALVAVLLPFWTNFLIRTYAWIVLLNNAGWINQALAGDRLIDEPLKLLYTQPAVVVGPALHVSAADDPAALRVARLRWTRSCARRRRTSGPSPWRVFRTVTLPLSIPGRAHRLHLRVRAEHGQLRHPRAARRRQDRAWSATSSATSS